MLERRDTTPEWMDGPDFGRSGVLGTFRFLVPVNRWFGGVRPVLSFFRRESRTWERGRTYRVLDVGCGAGDVPLALVRWSRRQGYRLRVDAIDRHAITVELARQRCRDYPDISVSCRDVFDLDGQETRYDYVHASQFLHHFPDEQVASVLRHLLGLCECKLVVNDLVRARLHYASAWVVTLFASPVFRHDARLSIRKGFTLDGLRGLLRGGGFDDFLLRWCFFYRFLLVLSVE